MHRAEQTATMSYQARRILSPVGSRKRKEREAFYTVKQSSSMGTATTSSKAVSEPSSSNQLLAGYMAHEFLTKGTLFGQTFDPARLEEVPLSASPVESRNSKPGSEAEPSRRSEAKRQSYAEVACLLKGDGAHIPGVVNPSQLARWIEM